MGSSKKVEIDWLFEDLDADKPLLAQLEERLYLYALDEEEFQAGLAWLDENIYKNRERRSLLEDTRDIIAPPGPKETIH